jgi:signal transduction histidine kinase
LVPLAAVLLGLLVSLGPLVQRIRRLTREVREFAIDRDQAKLSISGNDEIGELARVFAQAQSTIQARESALRDFLANTTHDVMIPLAALQGHLARIAEQGRGLSGLDFSEVGAASDEVHYLAALVHNLGIAARLEAGEPDPQRNPVDLCALVARASGRHATIARQHQVSLDHGVPPEPVVVLGDVTMLEQAVSNAVGNAVVYNRSGGHVAVLLEREGANQFVLKVVDDGPGLSDEELSHLLERGFRSDEARTRRPGGQGLGMHIAQEVTRRHGFLLEVRRSEFGGLEVIFRGPIAKQGGA